MNKWCRIGAVLALLNIIVVIVRPSNPAMPIHSILGWLVVMILYLTG